MANSVILAGTVKGDIEFSHKFFGERFYYFYLESERKSGVRDKIKCLCPDAYIYDITDGKQIEVEGSIRSFNIYKDGKSKVDLSVFVNKKNEYVEDKNMVLVNGYVCKEPVYRTTPLGREIGDMLIASNRDYGKSDYIPCIAWGRNALRVSKFDIGTELNLAGRFQSREYEKRLEDGTEEIRTAYELSLNEVEIANEED